MGQLMEIDELPDKTIIAGQEVKRPSYVSPSEWLRFWERVKNIPENYN